MVKGSFIFIVVLVIDLLTDLRLYREGKKVDHVRGAILRTVALIPAVYFLGWASAPMLFFLYVILFNGFYSLGIKKPWGYLGTTSVLDRLLKRAPWAPYAGLVLSILIYLKYGPHRVF